MTATFTDEDTGQKYVKKCSIRLDEIEGTQNQILNKIAGIETRLRLLETGLIADHLNERILESVKG